MAKVTGPLFSLSASGQIAKTLVFMKWKGIADVRKYVIPANPNTAAQQAQRATYNCGIIGMARYRLDRGRFNSLEFTCYYSWKSYVWF